MAEAKILANLIQAEFPFVVPEGTEVECLALPDGRSVPVLVHQSARASRYRINVAAGGEVRVIVPKRGSRRRALQFAREHAAWIARQVRRMAHRRPKMPRALGPGDPILFRGEWVPVLLKIEDGAPTISLADQSMAFAEIGSDLASAASQILIGVAERELPPRARELAALHGCALSDVVVRDLKASWGRCQHARRPSTDGARISLNWRLVQAPPTVSDYVILHELMHIREMNHSDRFWKQVAGVCPAYRDAERWLKQFRHRVLG